MFKKRLKGSLKLTFSYTAPVRPTVGVWWMLWSSSRVLLCFYLHVRALRFLCPPLFVATDKKTGHRSAERGACKTSEGLCGASEWKSFARRWLLQAEEMSGSDVNRSKDRWMKQIQWRWQSRCWGNTVTEEQWEICSRPTYLWLVAVHAINKIGLWGLQVKLNTNNNTFTWKASKRN